MYQKCYKIYSRDIFFFVGYSYLNSGFRIIGEIHVKSISILPGVKWHEQDASNLPEREGNFTIYIPLL